MKYQSILLTITVGLLLFIARETYINKLDKEAEVRIEEYKIHLEKRDYITNTKSNYLNEPTIDSIYNAMINGDYNSYELIDTLYNRITSYNPPIEEHKDHPNYILLQIQKNK